MFVDTGGVERMSAGTQKESTWDTMSNESSAALNVSFLEYVYHRVGIQVSVNRNILNKTGAYGRHKMPRPADIARHAVLATTAQNFSLLSDFHGDHHPARVSTGGDFGLAGISTRRRMSAAAANC